MEQAIQLIEQWGTKLAEISAQVGPEVFALAMTTITIAAIGKLALGFALTTAGAVALYIVLALTKKLAIGRPEFVSVYNSTEKEHEEYLDALREYEQVQSMEGAYVISIIFLSVIGGAMFLIGLFGHIFDIWNWAALYDPRLIIAKNVLRL